MNKVIIASNVLLTIITAIYVYLVFKQVKETKKINVFAKFKDICAIVYSPILGSCTHYKDTYAYVNSLLVNGSISNGSQWDKIKTNDYLYVTQIPRALCEKIERFYASINELIAIQEHAIDLIKNTFNGCFKGVERTVEARVFANKYVHIENIHPEALVCSNKTLRQRQYELEKSRQLGENYSLKILADGRDSDRDIDYVDHVISETHQSLQGDTIGKIYIDLLMRISIQAKELETVTLEEIKRHS